MDAPASSEFEGAEYCRDAKNFIGAYPSKAQVDGELEIDVAPFRAGGNQGDNVPAIAAQHREPTAPQAQGPAEPRAAGALS